ncbi:MAG: hypothetical protein EXX96DRAFT_537696 [Benjaminiella poitrasii]|nr:MAG: hypothetical protein EXX96DRAFT_537696 [Benjaminiella poitrasii]
MGYIPIYILYGYKKLKLRELAYDSSYVRECVGYSTLKSIGAPASVFFYARFIETFQDPWLTSGFAGGNNHYKPGLLYQGQAAGANERISLISDLSYYKKKSWYNVNQYKIKAGVKGDETSKDYKALHKFTKFVKGVSKKTTVKNGKSISILKALLERNMTISNLLGFSEHGKMIHIPADLDTSISTTLFSLEKMLSRDYSEHPGFTLRPLTRTFFANDELLNSYQHRLYDITRKLINPNVTFPFINSVVNMITPDVEWDQSLPRVGQTLIFNVNTLIPYSSDTSLMNRVPSGANLEMAFAHESFEEAVNGPIDSNTTISVKGFIS